MCLAIPGRIVEITHEPGPDESPVSRTGRVSFGGIVKDINLAYVQDAMVDDYVIVHVGFAISKVDEAEALQVFAYLKEMEGLDELEAEGGEAS